MSNTTILIVENDPVILKTTRNALKQDGYRVLEANTLTESRSLMERETPNLIILDILLPDGNGLNYCAELRNKSGVPILLLSEFNTKRDIVAGLYAGGDYYLPKPYDMEFLLAQVEAILRRERLNTHKNAFLCIGALELDTISRRAYLNGQDLMLKPKEFIMLEVLVRQKGDPLNAQELYERVWGLNAVDDVRTIWVHISAIRRKLGDPEETGSPWLLTRKNKGYYLALEEM